MQKVQYKGTSHYREFSAADFKSVGLEGQTKMRFARSDMPEHKALEVDDEVATWLTDTYPGEFEIVNDEAEPLSKGPEDNEGDQQPTGTVEGEPTPVGGADSTAEGSAKGTRSRK